MLLRSVHNATATPSWGYSDVIARADGHQASDRGIDDHEAQEWRSFLERQLRLVVGPLRRHLDKAHMVYSAGSH